MQANQTVFRMLGPVGDSNGFITAQVRGRVFG